MNFSLFNSRKGVNLPQLMTWWAGLGGELTWHQGPVRGCNVASRPRGRATAGPREAQVALTGPRRRPLGAPRGMWGVRIWRAHGYSGALVREGGGNTFNPSLSPSYLTAWFSHIFSVWDYIPHGSYLCRKRSSPPDVGCDLDGEDRVDPSPRDHQIRHVRKW